jgi:nicotinate phosphoribosyltransferase
MRNFKDSTGLYTDQYELTMAQGYFLSGNETMRSCFDYFFRKNPFNGGYVLFSGLNDLFEALENFRFAHEECIFLASLGFDKRFIEHLKSFSFKGNIYSVHEGEVIFPNEPVVRVEGTIIECQLIESILLNILNFQSLIATKASRMRQASVDKLLYEFGLRRAQGLGAIHASRAAIIGGFDSTSNTYSAFYHKLKSGGTMAHSWVQVFENELEAFRVFVKYNPDTAVLLVDTFDTIKSGIPNAIKVAKEMESKGNRLAGIRLDSGDLAYLSKTARKMLDEAQLHYVKIIASNQLDEHLIKSLNEQNAPINAYGIGTALVTGKDEGALDGVYKIAQINNRSTMKMSENISKMTYPGIKTIYRYYDDSNRFYADGIELLQEDTPEVIYHPYEQENYTDVTPYKKEQILNCVMRNGKNVSGRISVKDISNIASKRLKQLPEEMKRFENPHIYKVGIGEKLKKLQNNTKDKLW